MVSHTASAPSSTSAPYATWRDECSRKSSAGQPAGPNDPAGLILERLPSGELAWLRPEAELARAIAGAEALDQDLAALVERCDGVLLPTLAVPERLPSPGA